MSSTEVLSTPAQNTNNAGQKRKAVNAIWQPFLQFKLLMYMLGTTAVVAILLSIFLYFAFSDLIGTVVVDGGAQSYYAEMIEMQLVHLFRYCGVLFILYILLLAVVCVVYTHKLIGPFRPFNRHVDAMIAGDFQSRVNLRAGDPDMFRDYADKLNKLAEQLENRS